MLQPLRTCLLGVPGVGKSKCIKWLQGFFEDCLGWENGVQYVCLASENTMAALIGGMTFHAWASIPINLADAIDKGSSARANSELDEFFLRCLNLRFVLVDESQSAALLVPQHLGYIHAARVCPPTVCSQRRWVQEAVRRSEHYFRG